MIGNAPSRSRGSLIKSIYLSPFGWAIVLALRVIAPFARPIMVFGYYNRVTRQFNRLTRISSTAKLMWKRSLDIADDTFVWHYAIIDASNGVKIGRGCQIGAWVGIFTHSSHLSIRLLGAHYFDSEESERAGWRSGSVEIGDYTFVAAQSLILPGTEDRGRAALFRHKAVSGVVPDFAIVAGNPAQVVGDTRKLDRRYLSDPTVRATYYAPELLEQSAGVTDQAVFIPRK